MSSICSFLFFFLDRKAHVRVPKKQVLYKIPLEFRLGIVRTVDVKASSREVAEHRALKRNPEALGVKRA